MKNDKFSRIPNKVCFFSSSGSHLWCDAKHVILDNCKYSEIVCMNTGCTEIDRILIE